MRQFYKPFFLIITLLFFISADSCYARAGGGGGRSSSGSSSSYSSGYRSSSSTSPEVLYLLIGVVVVLVIYSVLTTKSLAESRKEVGKLSDDLKVTMEQFEESDKVWNYRSIRARVDEVFMEVQKAWMERNQDLAREFMTDRLYNKHKQLTDEMLASGTKNILADIQISSAMIVSVSDYKDDAKDTFSVLIEGSMTDYNVDDKTNQLISGNASGSEDFAEIWVFVREGNTWLAHQINQNLDSDNPYNNVSVRAYSESTAA